MEAGHWPNQRLQNRVLAAFWGPRVLEHRQEPETRARQAARPSFLSVPPLGKVCTLSGLRGRGVTLSRPVLHQGRGYCPQEAVRKMGVRRPLAGKTGASPPAPGSGARAQRRGSDTYVFTVSGISHVAVRESHFEKLWSRGSETLARSGSQAGPVRTRCPAHRTPTTPDQESHVPPTEPAGRP